VKFEIEHKFLVIKEAWDSIEKPNGIPIKQGYLLDTPGKTIRVRIKGDQGFLTIKGAVDKAKRLEYEYPVPVADAEDLLKHFTEKHISKLRYIVEFAGHTWEVDEFLEENEGLLLAEIELKTQPEHYEKPPWTGKDVTKDVRYYNSSLVKNPFKTW
jgi:adenylate cyclase